MLALIFISANMLYAQSDSTSKFDKYVPTTHPTYTPEDRYGNPFYNPDSETPFIFGLPKNYGKRVTVDDSLKNYTIEESMGDIQYHLY